MKEKLTAEQIFETLKRNKIDVGLFAHSDFEGLEEDFPNNEESIIDYKDEEVLNPKTLGEFYVVDGHDEDSTGSEWYSVKYFKDHDVYIRTDGTRRYSEYGEEVDFDEAQGYGYEVKKVATASFEYRKV